MWTRVVGVILWKPFEHRFFDGFTGELKKNIAHMRLNKYAEIYRFFYFKALKKPRTRTHLK